VNRIQAEEQSNRDSLFGGMLDQASNFVFGDNGDNTPSASASASDQVNGLSNSLNDTRDALNERGRKLESLGEKTSEMVNASADFAKMAKELQKKSEGGLFW
jgi:ABC-type transporter Mla subunit MlaD